MNVKKCKNCKHFHKLFFEDGKDAGIGLCRYEGLKKRKAATAGAVCVECPYFEFDEEQWLNTDREKRREKACQKGSPIGSM